MLLLESFADRSTFADVVTRWMLNRLEANDVFLAKKIINFNTYAAGIWLDHLAEGLFDRFQKSCIIGFGF